MLYILPITLQVGFLVSEASTRIAAMLLPGAKAAISKQSWSAQVLLAMNAAAVLCLLPGVEPWLYITGCSRARAASAGGAVATTEVALDKNFATASALSKQGLIFSHHLQPPIKSSTFCILPLLPCGNKRYPINSLCTNKALAWLVPALSIQH